MATKNKTQLPHLVAGFSGGISATLLLHPLDLIKVRLQVQDSNIPVSVQVATKVVPPTNRHFYQGTFDAFRQIARSEGLPGLYVGVTPNTVGAGLAWGSYFFFMSI